MGSKRMRKEAEEFLQDYKGEEREFIKKNNRAVIVSCSGTKTGEAELIPAVDRYIGKEFNEFKITADTYNLDLYVVSAQWGLISGDFKIPKYEKTFNSIPLTCIDEIIEELHIRQNLDKLLKMGYEDIYICIGQQYLRTLDYTKPLETDSNVIIFSTEKNEDMDCNFTGNNVNTIFINYEGTQTTLTSSSRMTMKPKILARALRQGLYDYAGMNSLVKSMHKISNVKRKTLF